MLFQNEVAIITGAGQGIGFAIARELSLQGAKVLLNDLDASLAKLATEKIQREGGECIAFAGDAGDVSFIKSAVNEAVKNFGKLTIAIPNAGITLYGDFFSYSPDALQKVLQLNISGSFFLAQAAAQQMREQKNGGSILLMSSVTGHQAHQYLTAYGMTKAALEMMAKNLVIALSPFHITINAVAPGATITERTMHEDPNYEKIWSGITPMGKPATTADIAQAALFFLSPLNRHITGQSLIIDGGWTSVSPSPDLEYLGLDKRKIND